MYLSSRTTHNLSLTIFFIPFSIFLAIPADAQTTVYRCTTPSGKIEFRQIPCGGETDETELTIEDTRTGWTPPTEAVTSANKSSSTSKKSTSDAAKAAAKRKKDCFKKRQQLERAQAELRRGYSAARGETLKQRRREYEAYMREFCR